MKKIKCFNCGHTHSKIENEEGLSEVVKGICKKADACEDIMLLLAHYMVCEENSPKHIKSYCEGYNKCLDEIRKTIETKGIRINLNKHE